MIIEIYLKKGLNSLEAILNFDLSVFKFIEDHLWMEWFDKIVPIVTWLGDGAFWIIVGVLFCIPKKTRKIGFVMLAAQLIMLIANNVILKSIFSRTRPFALFNPAVASKCVNGYSLNGKQIDGWMPEGYLTQVADEMKTYSAEFINKWLATFHYPDHIGYPYAHGYSFPSGHTSSSFAAACGLFAAATKKQKIIGAAAILLAAIIGYTRMYLHVHYCTDVLVGAVVGILCAVGGYFAIKAILKLVEKKTGKTIA